MSCLECTKGQQIVLWQLDLHLEEAHGAARREGQGPKASPHLFRHLLTSYLLTPICDMKKIALISCAVAVLACLGEGFTVYNVTAFSPRARLSVVQDVEGYNSWPMIQVTGVRSPRR